LRLHSADAGKGRPHHTSSVMSQLRSGCVFTATATTHFLCNSIAEANNFGA
jgi:hypothetical protein